MASVSGVGVAAGRAKFAGSSRTGGDVCNASALGGKTARTFRNLEAVPEGGILVALADGGSEPSVLTIVGETAAPPGALAAKDADLRLRISSTPRTTIRGALDSLILGSVFQANSGRRRRRANELNACCL